MLLRRPHSNIALSSNDATALVSLLRCYHMPGWKTKISTKDARTREQREADRKVRQIEKLPRPLALHDFQYPYEKTILSDTMFQYPVYENELDTPHLFNLTPPPDFFLFWNVSDFERTAYPPLPATDHRALVPGPASPPWAEHRQRSLAYLRKHEIVPQYLPHVRQDVNLSVVFPGTYATRARVDEETGEALPPPPPVTELSERNFWMTSHCGNYIELTDLQHPPSVFFWDEGMRSEQDHDAACYTLLIASPDYPYRVPSTEDGQTQRGFFLHYMVANLSAKSPATACGATTVAHTEGLAKRGDVVVPYIPPLPTEDAGTTRHICMLFRQKEKVEGVKTLDTEEAFPFEERAAYRLHASHRKNMSASAAETLAAVELVLPPDASAVTFFQTKWDIQVQEFYERYGMPEPALPVDDEMEAVLAYHAKRPEELRVRARHRPDGATNMGDDANFWAQSEETRMMDGTMQSLWSRRTAMGKNGVPVTQRH